MRNIFESMLNSLKTFFTRLTKRERIRLGIIAGLVVLLAIGVALLLGYVEYSVLYSNLPAEKAGQVIGVLDEMQVPYRTSGSGTILVPADQAATVSMRLANDTTLKEDGFNIDTYTSLTGSMTATSEDRRILWQYTLGENIRTALIQNPEIEDALVSVNLPEESSFLINNNEQSSVSVMLKIYGDAKLSDEKIRGIAEYLKGTISGLTDEYIKITDTNYNFYDLSEESISTDINDQLAYKKQVQEMMEENISKILMPLFGFNGFEVVVTPDIDFDRTETESTTWAPPVPEMTEGLAVSASRLLEIVRPGFEEGDVPGTDTNGLGTVEYPYGDIADDEEYRKAVEEYNYELNEFHTRTLEAMGQIIGMSVSVVVDSNLAPEDILEDVRDLVGGAIGVDNSNVTVMRSMFQENTEATDAFDLIQKTNADKQWQDMLRLIIIVACVLFAVILLVVALISIARIYNRRMEEEARALSAQLSAEAAAAQAAAGAYGYTAGHSYDVTIGGGENEFDENGVPIKPIDSNSGKSELMVELEDFIERDPSSAVAMLRNWLSEE